MRILLSLITLVLFLGCKKSKENTTEILCHQEMKERLKSELRCEEKDKLEVNLYSGSYEGQKIFFPMTMCPACNTIPPQFGYTCDGSKITISEFNTKVSAIKEIYNSCTNKFTD